MNFAKIGIYPQEKKTQIILQATNKSNSFNGCKHLL